MNETPSDELQSSSTLQEAAQKYGLDLPESSFAPLEGYCRLLWEWNEKINLTRHTTYDLFVRRDLLDTVKLSAHIPADEDVLDVGTGGGVPGLLLAILRPDLQISVCDSIAKKAGVVQEMVAKLKLPVDVYSQRVQLVLEDYRYHSLVTRATGSIAQLLRWVSEHWIHFDKLLAIKGPRWVQERGEARHLGLMNGIELRCLESYSMPETESESSIISLSRKRPGQ